VGWEDHNALSAMQVQSAYPGYDCNEEKMKLEKERAKTKN